jgi:hypothetical protein
MTSRGKKNFVLLRSLGGQGWGLGFSSGKKEPVIYNLFIFLPRLSAIL